MLIHSIPTYYMEIIIVCTTSPSTKFNITKIKFTFIGLVVSIYTYVCVSYLFYKNKTMFILNPTNY